jgi:Spy/CpxP family protein refolding chaperone
MKKLLIPALAVAVASAALPAAAQNYDRHGPSRGHGYEQNYGGWNSISQRKHNLDRRIDQGIRNHQLSRREASRLQDELNSLVRLERSYMRGGLTRWERQDLDRRYDRLSAKVRYERNDHNGRRH